MARKAPLLGLINQGKCLAVTHRAVLSRGSSLMAALSFMAGPLSLFSPELSGDRAANAPLIHRCLMVGFWRLDCRARAHLASLWTGRDDDGHVDDPAFESKAGVLLSWPAV